jgi:transaldolase
MKIRIFADGADKQEMLDLYRNPQISGFTTNPTLMRKAGVTDYEAFAKEVLKHILDRPISFEVFSDEFDEMERQALKISSWGPNVYVKIPVTNCAGEATYSLVRRLASRRVRLNVTAVMTLEQVRNVSAALGDASSYISVFAGRIADTGRDPVPLITKAVGICQPHQLQELIWASPRELLNIYHAESAGCHIITVTSDILKKLSLIDKDLREHSLETVRMFRGDAIAAGYRL